MATYTIKLDTERFSHLIGALSSSLEEPDVLLYAIGRTLVRTHQERHQRGVDPEGNPWPALKHPGYPEGRKGGPLNRTGAMLKSLNYNVEGDTLRIGFVGAEGAPAKYHQEGSKAHSIEAKQGRALKLGALGIYRKRVHHPGLPPRPLLGFPESDRELVEEVLKDYLLLTLERQRADNG